MKFHEADDPGDFPVLEGTATELAQVASAALAAVQHREAVLRQRGVPVIAFQLFDEEAT